VFLTAEISGVVTSQGTKPFCLPSHIWVPCEGCDNLRKVVGPSLRQSFHFLVVLYLHEGL
jgi:hypothetical protein